MTLIQGLERRELALSRNPAEPLSLRSIGSETAWSRISGLLFGYQRATTLADPKLEALRVLGAAITRFGAVPDWVQEVCHQAGWRNVDIDDAVRYVLACRPRQA